MPRVAASNSMSARVDLRQRSARRRDRRWYRGKRGSRSGEFMGGGVNVGVPASPIPTGRVGGKVGFTLNGEIAERIYDPSC